MYSQAYMSHPMMPDAI